jgi:hypothetical protein
MATVNTGFLHLDEKVKKGILTDTAKASYLSKLGISEPIDLTVESVLSFSDFSGAQAVAEGAPKVETPFSAKLTKIQRGMLQSQVRISVQALDKSEAQGVKVIEAAQTTMAGGLGLDIDLVATHNTSPNSGADTVDFTVGLAKGDTTVVHQMVAGEKPDAALRAAIVSLMSEERDITGIAVSPKFFSELAYQTDQFGRLLYPQLTLTSNKDDLVFDGIKLVISKSIANKKHKTGTPSGVSFIVGDFSKIRWGIEVRSVEMITQGDPDNTGRDLKGHNEVMLRLESWLEYLIEDKTAFVVGKDAV